MTHQDLPWLPKQILDLSTTDRECKEVYIEILTEEYNAKLSKGMSKWEADRWVIDQAVRTAWATLPDDFKRLMFRLMEKMAPILVAWLMKQMM